MTGVDLERQLDFFYSDTVCRLWGRLFRCQYEGPFKLDPEEVESGQFMSLEVRKLCKIPVLTGSSQDPYGSTLRVLLQLRLCVLLSCWNWSVNDAVPCT